MKLRREPAELVIFVHELFSSDNRSGATDGCIRVTKLSPISSTYPFAPEVPTVDNFDCNELVLHFRDCGKMGLPEDAESICLSDIISARALDIRRQDGVEYTTPGNSSKWTSIVRILLIEQ